MDSEETTQRDVLKWACAMVVRVRATSNPTKDAPLHQRRFHVDVAGMEGWTVQPFGDGCLPELSATRKQRESSGKVFSMMRGTDYEQRKSGPGEPSRRLEESGHRRLEKIS